MEPPRTSPSKPPWPDTADATALLDTGAEARNYVSLAWIRSHWDSIGHLCRDSRHSVRLGDSLTVKKVEYEVDLSIKLMSHSGKIYDYTGTFLVFDTQTEIYSVFPPSWDLWANIFSISSLP